MLKIGKIRLKNNLILAPMLGVSCNSFRLLCKKYGAGLITIPMIHPDSLFHQEDKLDIINEERPVSVQIVGRDVVKMSKAAMMLEQKADIIDINLGCPDKEILEQKAGAFLIKHPEQIGKMVSKVINSVNCPVTAKIRIGWDNKSINAVEVAKKLEDLGIGAITVHGRTRKQVYSGNANFNVIKEVKEKVNVPVIGNGDVFKPENYKKMLEKTKVDFVMIGRGAIGDPLIFQNCLNYANNKKIIKKDLKQAYKLFLEFLDYYKKYSPRDSISEIRQHAMWFVKGLKYGSFLRNKISRMDNIEDIKKVLKIHKR